LCCHPLHSLTLFFSQPLPVMSGCFRSSITRSGSCVVETRKWMRMSILTKSSRKIMRSFVALMLVGGVSVATIVGMSTSADAASPYMPPSANQIQVPPYVQDKADNFRPESDYPSGTVINATWTMTMNNYVAAPDERTTLFLNKGFLEVWRDGEQRWIAPNGKGGMADGDHVTFQSDGNLVLYSGDAAQWASNTTWGCGVWNSYVCVLDIQNDGNVVIYNSLSLSAVWATGTQR
jgi:hypothetical protein